MFHGARARVQGNIGKRRVVRAVSRGEKLGAEKGEVVRNGKDEGLLVKVVDGSGDVTTSDDPQSSILNDLQTGDSGNGCIRKPNGSGIIYCCSDVRFPEEG